MNKVLVNSVKMDWRTPKDFFRELNQEFHFGLDAAASPENAKCSCFFTPEMNGLSLPWSGYGVVFCNPPYGRGTGKWVQKAYSEHVRGGGDNRHVDSSTDGHKLFPRLHIWQGGNSLSSGAAEI